MMRVTSVLVLILCTKGHLPKELGGLASLLALYLFSNLLTGKTTRTVDLSCLYLSCEYSSIAVPCIEGN